MSTHSTDREISKLQQDVPVSNLPTLPSANTVSAESVATAKTKKDEKTKPFFLYPKDGLYGLL